MPRPEWTALDNEGRQFSTDEIAHIASVTRRTIQRWSGSGRITLPYRTPGNRPYYTASHIKQILPHLDDQGVARLIEQRMSTYEASPDADEVDDANQTSE